MLAGMTHYYQICDFTILHDSSRFFPRFPKIPYFRATSKVRSWRTEK